MRSSRFTKVIVKLTFEIKVLRFNCLAAVLSVSTPVRAHTTTLISREGYRAVISVPIFRTTILFTCEAEKLGPAREFGKTGESSQETNAIPQVGGPTFSRLKLDASAELDMTIMTVAAPVSQISAPTLDVSELDVNYWKPIIGVYLYLAARLSQQQVSQPLHLKPVIFHFAEHLQARKAGNFGPGRTTGPITRLEYPTSRSDI